MKRTFISSVLLAAAFALVGLAADAPTPTTRPEVAAIMAGDPTTRTQAVTAFIHERQIRVQELCTELKKAAITPDRDYRGSLNMLLSVTSYWRPVEVIDILLPIIDLKLDAATLPVGGKYGTEAYFPVASCLGTIGGPVVMDKVVERMNKEMDESTLRLCTYVLDKCCNQNSKRDTSIAVVESYLSRAGLPVQRANLAKALTLLKGTEHGILPAIR